MLLLLQMLNNTVFQMYSYKQASMSGLSKG